MLSPEEVAKNEPMLIKLANAIPLRIRLKGVKPEERPADLAPEQAVLALPDAVLRGLSAEYLATLPADVQATVRARLAR